MSASKKLIPKRRFKAFEDREAWSLLEQLNKYAEILTGGTPNTQVKDFWMPKEVPWMSSGEINKKRIFSTDNMISLKGLDNSSARWIKEKSILIALAGQGKTRGKVAINELQITTNQSIAAVVPNEKLDSEFLFQNLGMRYEELRSISSGDGSRGGLNKKIISELHATIPNIDEQKIIGMFFQKLDHLINTQQKKLEKTKTLKSAYLTEMFPNEGELKPRLRFSGFRLAWEKYQLGEVAHYRRGAFPQPYGYEKWYNGNNSQPFVQVVDVTNQLKLAHKTKQRISKLAQPFSVFVPAGRIIVTLQGSIGRVAITQYDSYIDRTLLVFENFIKKIDLTFWAYTIQQLFEIEKKKAPGGTIKTITKEALSNFYITLPTEQEQTKIGNFFKLLDNKIALEQKKLDKLKNIKQAYLNEMFI